MDTLAEMDWSFYDMTPGRRIMEIVEKLKGLEADLERQATEFRDCDGDTV